MSVNETSGSALVILKPRSINEDLLSLVSTPMTSSLMAVTVGGTGRKKRRVKSYWIKCPVLTYDFHCFSDLMRAIAVSSVTGVVA